MNHPEERWSVGEVVAYLQRWFPDVRPSQLRYWEQLGLIQAHRSPGGHRLYCPEKVEELRKLLFLRRWFRLPLSETARILENIRRDPGLWLLYLEHGHLGGQEPEEDPDIVEKGLAFLGRLGIPQRCPETGEPLEEVQRLGAVAGRLLQETGLQEEDLKTFMKEISRLVETEARLAMKSGLPMDRIWELLRRFRLWAHLYFVRKTLYSRQRLNPQPQKEVAP